MNCIVFNCKNKGRSKGKGVRGKLCEKHHRLRYPRNRMHMLRRADRARLKAYGINRGQYIAMMKDQDNACGICGNTLVKPYIDHCHKSGKVRGLLCGKCNWALGMFNDDIDLLASATSYLLNSISRKETA